MAHSRHTDKEWIQAARRLRRDADGEIRLPPIITRKPRRGDIHPVTRPTLEKWIWGVGFEYFHGLKRIELKARPSERIGEPFGCYSLRDHIIVLYSLPMIWQLDRLNTRWEINLSEYGASIERDGIVTVSWRDDSHLKIWFWDQVVVHELGHHFVEQYKHRNGRVRTIRAHEGLADIHVGRYLSQRFQVVKAIQERKKAQAGENDQSSE